jgi:plasmid stabilization system protein ParE
LRKVILLSGAKADIREASRFYEAERPGFGDLFLTRFHQALSQVREYPLTAPTIYGQYRRMGLKQFSHSIVYSVEANQVVVVAVLHNRRNPDYWKRRI